MTKNELITAVADKAQMTKTAAATAVDATFDAITSTLKKGGEVKIMGFGNFRVVKRAAREQTRFGALYFGSTAPAMTEALEALEARGIHLDTMRVRAFPFHDDVLDFVVGHERVFVVEQNRDAQLRTLLISEADLDPARLVPILHYDGTPITARFIVKAIADMLAVVTLAPLKKAPPRTSTRPAPSPSLPRVRQDGGG